MFKYVLGFISILFYQCRLFKYATSTPANNYSFKIKDNNTDLDINYSYSYKSQVFI